MSTRCCGILKGYGRRRYLTSVRRIHGKRISDAELLAVCHIGIYRTHVISWHVLRGIPRAPLRSGSSPCFVEYLQDDARCRGTSLRTSFPSFRLSSLCTSVLCCNRREDCLICISYIPEMPWRLSRISFTCSKPRQYCCITSSTNRFWAL